MSQPFDDTAKTFYRQFFEQRGLRAIPQYEVFARSRAIDLLVECPAEMAHALDQTVFSHFKRFNCVEFKGINDNLNARDFNRILMRAWGIGGMNEPTEEEDEETDAAKSQPPFSTQEIARQPSQRTVTIVSVAKPVQVLTTLKREFKFEPTNEPGVYHSTEYFPVWIIHPSELTIKPANYPLLPLARGEKLAQFIEICITQELSDYLRLTIDIGQSNDPDFIWRKIMEMLNMTVTVQDETWQFVDQSLRRRPEIVHKVAFIQELIEEKGLEWIRQGIQIGKSEGIQIGKSEGIQIGKSEGIQIGERQALLTLLDKKFGPLPESVRNKVERTQDIEQIERWLDQLLAASSLADLGLLVES